MVDEELASIKSSAGTAAAGLAAGAGKVTRAEIEAHQTKLLSTATASSAGAASSDVVVDELPIEENVNRLSVDGLEARSVDEAIKLLTYVFTVIVSSLPSPGSAELTLTSQYTLTSCLVTTIIRFSWVNPCPGNGGGIPPSAVLAENRQLNNGLRQLVFVTLSQTLLAL